MDIIPNVQDKYKEKKRSWFRDLAISIVYEDIIRRKFLRKIFPKKKKGFTVKDKKNKKFFSRKKTKAIKEAMNLDRKEILAAYNLTKELLLEMHEKCQKHNIKLCFLLIPTMHSTYSPYLKKNEYKLPKPYVQLN